MEEDIYLVYGVTQYIISDNGSKFIGSPITISAKKYLVKMLLNVSQHPQEEEWDKYLPQIGFALRSAYYETTETEPRELPVTEETDFNVFKSRIFNLLQTTTNRMETC